MAVAAIKDVDVIRTRAGLTPLSATNPAISKNNLLLAIETERRHELFTEWGHRLLDLKRTNRALTALSQKEGLSADDLLYPLPAEEFKRNPALGNQNHGY